MKKYILTVTAFCFCVFLFGAAAPTHKEVDRASNPKYYKRTDPAWHGRARLIGELVNPPPEFTLSFYLSSKPSELVCTKKFSGKLSVYESDWLPAGVYEIFVKADGYSKYRIAKIDLKASNDCAINIYFGIEDYNGRPE